MCTIESPIALWTGDYKSGRELIVTPEGQAAIHDQLAKKGYVQVMVDANTRQLLQTAANSFCVTPSAATVRLPGKNFLAKPHAVQNLPPTPLELASVILHDIARCVLRTFVSAPDGIGSAERLDRMLDETPGGTSGLLADKLKTVEEDPQAAYCRSHDWYKTLGLLDVVWSVEPGLQVRNNGQIFTLPHGHGYMVTVLLGITLEHALLHTVRASEHRAVNSLVRTAKSNYEAALQRQQQAAAVAGNAGPATAAAAAAAAGTGQQAAAGTAAPMAADTHNVGAATAQAAVQVPPAQRTVTTQAGATAAAAAVAASQQPPSGQSFGAVFSATNAPIQHPAQAPQAHPTAAFVAASTAAMPAMSLEALLLQITILKRDVREGRVTREEARGIGHRLFMQASPTVRIEYVAFRGSLQRQQAGHAAAQPQPPSPAHAVHQQGGQAPEVIHLDTSPEPPSPTGQQQHQGQHQCTPESAGQAGQQQQQATGVVLAPGTDQPIASANAAALAGQQVHVSEGAKHEVKQSDSSGDVKPQVAQASTGDASLMCAAPLLHGSHGGAAAAAGGGGGDGGRSQPIAASDAAGSGDGGCGLGQAAAAPADAADPVSTAAAAVSAAADSTAVAAAPAAQAEAAGPTATAAMAELPPNLAAAAEAAAAAALAQPDTAAAPAAPTGPNQLEAMPERTPTVMLVLRDQQQSELQFRIKHTTRMGKVIDKYCERRGVDPNSVTFVFDGAKFERFQTPVDLGMVDGDIVDVLSV